MQLNERAMYSLSLDKINLALAQINSEKQVTESLALFDATKLLIFVNKTL